MVPALLIHGEADEIVPISASEFVESNIGSTVKIFKVFFWSYILLILVYRTNLL